MKLFIYLLQFIVQLGESQPLWKVVYNTKNWYDFCYQDLSNYGLYCSNFCTFSNCGDSSLLGGHKQYSKFSSFFNLPGHASIKITFDFWKIDLWDQKLFEYLADNYNQVLSFNDDQGQNICGDLHRDLIQTITVTLSPHLSSSLNVLMTTNLDSTNVQLVDIQGYWGLNHIKIEIEECPGSCAFCQDSTFECKQWINFASYYSYEYSFDGWLIDNNQPFQYSRCFYFSLAGGVDKLFKGQSIEKLIQNLPPHFKVHIVVKLWVFGKWNETFNLDIDNQLIYSKNIYNLDLNTIISCNSQQLKIFNIDASTYHTSPEILIKMKSVKDSTHDGYWGISSFDLYVAQCSVCCEDCYWNKVYKRIRCIKLFGFLNGKCVPAPPLECSYININHVFSLETNSINQFELKINELNLVMRKIGQIPQIVDKIFSKISIQIQVQCQEKKQISSFFRTCDGCEGEKYSFYNYCPSQSSIFNYNATFTQVVEYEKELLYSNCKQNQENQFKVQSLCLNQKLTLFKYTWFNNQNYEVIINHINNQWY